MNGRGDDTMTMFQGYGHIVDFFTSFDWWKTEPHDELVNGGNYCLAKPGEVDAVYFPRAGSVTVESEPGKYEGTWWNASTGEKGRSALVNVIATSWTSPAAPGGTDWALLLRGGSRNEMLQHVSCTVFNRRVRHGFGGVLEGENIQPPARIPEFHGLESHDAVMSWAAIPYNPNMNSARPADNKITWWPSTVNEIGGA